MIEVQSLIFNILFIDFGEVQLSRANGTKKIASKILMIIYNILIEIHLLYLMNSYIYLQDSGNM